MSTSELQPTGPSEYIADVSPDLMRSMARSVARVDSTAPPAEQVEVVVALDRLSRVIVETNRRVMAGESESIDWPRLAELFARATQACRRQIVGELRDIGDSGSH